MSSTPIDPTMEGNQPITGQESHKNSESLMKDKEPPSQSVAASNVDLSAVVDHDDPFADLGPALNENNDTNDAQLGNMPSAINKEHISVDTDISSMEPSPEPSNHIMPASQTLENNENAASLINNETNQDENEIDESLLISSINHDYEPPSQSVAASNVDLSAVVDHDDPFADLGPAVNENNDTNDAQLGNMPSINNENISVNIDISSMEPSPEPSNHIMPASQTLENNENAASLINNEANQDENEVDESLLISSINHDYDNVFTDSMIESDNQANQGQDNEIAATSITNPLEDNDQEQSDLLGSSNDEPPIKSATNDPIEVNDEPSDEIAAAAVYTASATLSEPQQSEPSEQANEEIMNAIPLMAATEAMASQPDDEILRTPQTENYEIKPFDKYEQSIRQMGYPEQPDDEKNLHASISIYEDKEITTFDQYEKSCRQMGCNDDDRELSDVDKDEIKPFDKYEKSLREMSYNADEDKLDNQKEKSSKCWFNVAAFTVIVVISGVIIALVLIFIPSNETTEEDTPEPPKQVLKQIIEGSCIKGQSIGMSSDGNKIIYINSDVQLDNKDVFNTSIILYNLNDNKTTIINTMTNVESALTQTIPVTISSDGNTIAYASYDTENFTNVHVYQADDNNYKPIGDSIQLLRLPGILSLALSNNANHLAIGNPKDIENGVDSGKAALYSYTNDKWKLQDDNIIGKVNAMAGSSVALAHDKPKDTLIFSASAPSYDNIGSVFSNVYDIKANENNITFVNQTVQQGMGENSLFGASISLSDDGHRMAIGSPDYSYDNTDNNGQCNVYEYSSDTLSWTSIGESIIGENANYHFGYEVALSGDGKRLAISSKNPFIVTLYEYSNENWGMIGSDFTYPDDNSIQYGSSISLNFDGSILAISTNNGGANDSAAKCGKVFLYSIDDNTAES